MGLREMFLRRSTDLLGEYSQSLEGAARRAGAHSRPCVSARHSPRTRGGRAQTAPTHPRAHSPTVALTGYNWHVTETLDFPPQDPKPSGWLDHAEITAIRQQVPIVYVDAVPVQVDSSGDVVAVGLLLRVTPEGVMTRALVSGRVMHHERIRDALLRHIEKDLGPVALPQIPSAPQPFTVAEYFPTPGITHYYDARQHAVSMAYIVPVTGDCRPQQDAIDLIWVSPEEAVGERIQVEMHGGSGFLLRQAMAHVGRAV